MFTSTKNTQNEPINNIEEKLLFPQLILFNECVNLSQLISNNFLYKISSTNTTHHQTKQFIDLNDKLNINNEEIYKEILKDQLFLNDLNQLNNSLNVIINHINEYSKKYIEHKKIKILFDLNIQLNEYLNNISKEKDKKSNNSLSSYSKINDIHIIDQINKFISLNEKDEQESKEIIIYKENNFDNLSEIREKESEKESVYEDEKEIIKNLDKNEKEKIFKKEHEFELNEDLSLLNKKSKKNKNIIDLDEY